MFKGYNLQVGDLLKLGRIEFRVLELKTDKSLAIKAKEYENVPKVN